jgi:hypothetical protein
MKRLEAPYLLFAVIFGFMALIAPDLREEHRLTFEGRVSMFLFQVAMEFLCALATAKHLHDKWVKKDIEERSARLRMPHPVVDDVPEPAESSVSASDVAVDGPLPASSPVPPADDSHRSR